MVSDMIGQTVWQRVNDQRECLYGVFTRDLASKKAQLRRWCHENGRDNGSQKCRNWR